MSRVDIAAGETEWSQCLQTQYSSLLQGKLENAEVELHLELPQQQTSL